MLKCTDNVVSWRVIAIINFGLTHDCIRLFLLLVNVKTRIQCVPVAIGGKHQFTAAALAIFVLSFVASPASAQNRCGDLYHTYDACVACAKGRNFGPQDYGPYCRAHTGQNANDTKVRKKSKS